MSRILLAWELGMGLGHLGPFLNLAPALLERGHTLHIAAREVAGAVRAVAGLPIAVHQAPLCLNNYRGLQEPPLNYSEILMRFGYLDSVMLRGMLTAWRSLMQMTGADVVIADHAPTALLAARSLGLPRAVIGSPFNAPPSQSPMPNMREWEVVPEARLADSDRRVLETINAVLPQPLPAVHGIFDGATPLLSGVPELDPYGTRGSDAYLGLHSMSTGHAVTPWPAGDGAAVFVYLHAQHPGLEVILKVLATSGARVLAYVSGKGVAWLDSWRSDRMVFSAEPVDFDRVLGQCALCVCHGNVGTSLGMLARGLPLLMLPWHLENMLLARRVAAAGAGRVLQPEQIESELAGVLAAMLSDPSYAFAARAIAQRGGVTSVGTMIDQAAARIEGLAVSAREHA